MSHLLAFVGGCGLGVLAGVVTAGWIVCWVLDRVLEDDDEPDNADWWKRGGTDEG